MVKAIRASLPRDVGGGDVDAGFEREISQEVQRRAARPFQGIAVPDQVFEVERRTLTVGSAAADLVPNPHMADRFIDRLRTALVMGRLGATVLDNLVGSPIDIPRQTGSSTAQWVAEDGTLILLLLGHIGQAARPRSASSVGVRALLDKLESE